MAYQKPTDIDGFVNQMAKADMRIKASLAEDLVAFLSDQENSIVSEDLGLLVDGLMPWLTGSHYKVRAHTQICINISSSRLTRPECQPTAR